MRQWLMVCGLAAVVASGSLSAAEGEAPTWVTNRFDLEFPGGTLREFIEMLQSQAPGLNVVVADEVQEVRVQALKLHGVNVGSALDTLDELLEPQLEMGPITGRIESTTPVILIRGNPGRLRTAAFATKNIPAAAGKPNVVEAIEFAIESLPDSDRRPTPKVRAHEPTGILIVTADEEQLRLIAQVVELLGGESRLSLGGSGLSSGGYPANPLGATSIRLDAPTATSPRSNLARPTDPFAGSPQPGGAPQPAAQPVSR